MSGSRIAENLASVRERIARAAARVGRDPRSVRLVVVTKGVGADLIREVVEAGADCLGENRVQEARQKLAVLGDLPVKWHMVGHLQTNKVKYVIGMFEMIHSLDRLSLAEELDRRAGQRRTTVDVLVQANVSGEQTKFGVAPEETVEFIRQVSRFEHVKVKGLMTMAPFVPDPELARPCFRRLRELADEVRREAVGGVDMDWLSMGMTNDFEVAIEEGANLVRIGTAIFGERREPGGNH